MIVLCSDFGTTDAYVGQLKLALTRIAPQINVIDLCHHLPMFSPRNAAHLLAAWTPDIPTGAVIVAVVDPGVGSTRRPIVLRTPTHTWVGPDNGLFNVVARRAPAAAWFEIQRRPSTCSSSFHGRDIFAPAAAQLAAGTAAEHLLLSCDAPDMGDEIDEIWEIIYIDHYGNAISGIRATSLPKDARLMLAERKISSVRTYSEGAEGIEFWFENSNGLVEFALYRGNISRRLDINIGARVELG